MFRQLMVLLVLASGVSAQSPAPVRGVFVEDIDKSANAWTSFFDYANGEEHSTFCRREC